MAAWRRSSAQAATRETPRCCTTSQKGRAVAHTARAYGPAVRAAQLVRCASEGTNSLPALSALSAPLLLAPYTCVLSFAPAATTRQCAVCSRASTYSCAHSWARHHAPLRGRRTGRLGPSTAPLSALPLPRARGLSPAPASRFLLNVPSSRSRSSRTKRPRPSYPHGQTGWR